MNIRSKDILRNTSVMSSKGGNSVETGYKGWSLLTVRKGEGFSIYLNRRSDNKYFLVKGGIEDEEKACIIHDIVVKKYSTLLSVAKQLYKSIESVFYIRDLLGEMSKEDDISLSEMLDVDETLTSLRKLYDSGIDVFGSTWCEGAPSKGTPIGQIMQQLKVLADKVGALFNLYCNID